LKESNRIEVHVTPRQSAPIRLQEYGVGIFFMIPTKSALKKALKKGQIKVDDVIATSATYIKGGETIRLEMHQHQKNKKKLILDLEVLYEDDYLAVINKPAGIAVSGNKFKTVANALSQHLTPSSLGDATMPQPVHRLDYPTTGAILIGKTALSIRSLNKMFEEKKVTKTYYAVTIGRMDAKGTVSTDIDAKKAHTTYEVIETVSSKRFAYLNLVRLSPSTGRRHQLRKHMTSLGNPILGDKDYYKEGLILRGKGLYLHAYSLVLAHPVTQEPMAIETLMPQKFKKLFGEII